MVAFGAGKRGGCVSCQGALLRDEESVALKRRLLDAVTDVPLDAAGPLLKAVTKEMCT